MFQKVTSGTIWDTSGINPEFCAASKNSYNKMKMLVFAIVNIYSFYLYFIFKCINIHACKCEKQPHFSYLIL